MFTVILLSQTARERFQEWRELFLPFLEEESIALCDWNHGMTIHDLPSAVPGLSEAIRGKQEWRLLAVGTGVEGDFTRGVSDPENPFDYMSNWDIEDDEVDSQVDLKESNYPLVRLSHMLLGFPELGVRSFRPDLSYWDRESGRRIYETEYVADRQAQGVSEQAAKEEFQELLPTRHDVQLHYQQIDLDEDDERAYRKLVRTYEIRQSRPSEVVFVALREPIPPRPVDELREAWKRGQRNKASRFVERNGYHPSCRFLVFDLHAEDHTAYELGEFRFWLAVLAVATNELPSSSVQPERLYAMDVDLDPDALSRTLNEHMAVLANMRERLDLEVRRSHSTSKLDIENYLQERPVEISFEHLNGDDLKVSSDGYGIASDRPRSEMSRWNESFMDVQAASEAFNRKPKRVLAKAVEGTRNSPPTPLELSEPLTDIEREELEEELSRRIERLSESTTRNILDKARLHNLLSEHRRHISRAIHERMSAATIIWTSVGIGIVWLLAFVPYFIRSFELGDWALADSLLIMGAIAALLIVVGTVTLRIMRRWLLTKIRQFNQAMKGYVNSVKDGASAFAQFLTDVDTYRAGRALLDAESKRAERDRRRRQDLFRDLNRIKDVIAREKSLVRSVGRSIEIRRVAQVGFDVQTWSARSLQQIVALPRSAGNCRFNNTGESITAPFDFVARLSLKDLALKENPARHKELVDELQGLQVNQESTA